MAFKDLCFTSFKRLDLQITSGLTEFGALFGECTYSLIENFVRVGKHTRKFLSLGHLHS